MKYLLAAVLFVCLCATAFGQQPQTTQTAPTPTQSQLVMPVVPVVPITAYRPARVYVPTVPVIQCQNGQCVAVPVRQQRVGGLRGLLFGNVYRW